MGAASTDDMLALLRKEGVKAVVFDFDCTITIKHSGGRVKTEKLAPYLADNISPCFQQVSPSISFSK
jgi:hypothetical protein